MKIVKHLAALAVLSLPYIASAQMSAQDNRVYFDYGEPFYASLNQSPDNKFIDVRLNTASSMFSFVRSSAKKDLDRGAYYAVRDVSIEVTEKGNVMPIVTRGFKDTIFVPRYEQSTAKNFWHAMNERLMLPGLDSAKDYMVRLEVRDAVLGKFAVRPMTMEPKIRWFDPNAFDSTRIGIGDLNLIGEQSGDTIKLESTGVTYPFSREIRGSYLLTFPATWTLEDFSADLALRQHANIYHPADTGDRARMTLSRSDLSPGMGYEFTREDSQIVFNVRPMGEATMKDGTRYKFALLNFTLPGASLEQGGYKLYLTVRAGGASRMASNTVNLRWKNMPVSLEDPRDAIAPMTHILTDSELRDLQSGERDTQFRKLFDYWKRRDPTPGTAYNENMAAFFQRVDYAYFNFASGRVLDGALTERGKIYILYGAPTNIERKLLPGESPTEVWTYTNNVDRQFTFIESGSQGNYKLVEMRNL